MLNAEEYYGEDTIIISSYNKPLSFLTEVKKNNILMSLKNML